MRSGVAVLFTGVLWASAAAAQDSASREVERGRELYLAADFEGAATAFERALGSESLTAEHALEAHRHLAALLLALGTETEARAHAAAAVALDPSATGPEGAPQGLEAMLDDARGERATVAVTSAAALERGEVAAIEARVSPAPDRLFGAVRLRCSDDADPSNEVDDERPPPRARVEITPSDGAATITCVAAALSRGGAELVAGERRFELGGGLEAEVVPPDDGGDEGGLPLWPFIAGGAAAAVVVAVVIIVVVSSSSGGDQARFGMTTVEGW